MTGDEEASRELVSTWMKATKDGDMKTVLDLMTDDVVFMTPGNPPMVGRIAFETAARGGIRAGTIDGQSEVDEVCVVGDFAYLRSTLTVTMRPHSGGTPVRRVGNTLSVLRREGGKWRIARDANMLAVVSTPSPAQ
ncbi:MAG TPA: SgcJ/EcaC family oxidoreductase [Candidatus Eisenbacteria bacterium]